MAIDGNNCVLSLAAIAIDRKYYWFNVKNNGRRWIYTLHNLLRSTMTIDRHPAQSMAGNCHRLTQYPIYCDGQHLSIGSVDSLLWLTMSIDTQFFVSITVAAMFYLLFFCPGFKDFQT